MEQYQMRTHESVPANPAASAPLLRGTSARQRAVLCPAAGEHNRRQNREHASQDTRRQARKATRTNKDWIKATLAHRETGAVPYNIMLSPPAHRRLELHYGTSHLEDALGLPLRMTSPKSVKPLYASPADFGPTATDESGVMWTTSDTDRGVPIGPCLREPDLSRYRFPDPAARYRFEDIGEWCRRNAQHYTIIWVGDLWERATFMRGMEELCCDLTLHPGFVEALLRGLTDYLLQTMQILFASFAFDGIAVSDDYGTQKAMLISPAHWRRFVRPCLSEIYSLAKSRGRTVFHHSCGDIIPIISDLTDIGLDILHPIQPEAMDITRLKREFGGHLTFCGGLRTQDLLPHGTPEAVREEVRWLLREMGEGGGYILEPGITVQADVPLENMLAMIEAARSPG
jgi:uroporphyrinogen decarboxylase